MKKRKKRRYLKHVFDEGKNAPEKVVRHADVLESTRVLVVVETAFERKDGALQVVLVEGECLVDLEVEVMKGLQEEIRAGLRAVALVESTSQ